MSETAQSTIEQELRAFIVEYTLEHPFGAEDPLAAGAVDSLGLEMVVGFIDETYGITLDESDFIAENFESLAALGSLVRSKSQSNS